MRKIKEVLRLSALEALSERQIAQSANMRKTTVRDYLRRAAAAHLGWDEAQAMDDESIDRLLFPRGGRPKAEKVLPDWGRIHTELRRPHVTLQLLWEEYHEQHPDGYRYSRFCALYRIYARTVDVTMRQTHRAGEKLFVDYSGTRVEVIDPSTGEARMAEIFVAVLGASNYTYAEATWTQGLRDWIGSHTRAFSFFGGVPAIVVPDNLKAGVRKASYYDPEINPTYQRMAEHYGVAVIPARVGHPKDKAKVEAGVLLVERWILARLCNRTFFSLGELNEAIAELIEPLNAHPFRKMPGSRRSLFEALDQPALGALPGGAFIFEEWKKATVNIDYHIAFDDHFYSVPYQLVKQQVSVRATAQVIEVYHRGKRAAAHARSYVTYGYTTVAGHMPAGHRWQHDWTPVRLVSWGRKSGAHVAALFEAILAAKTHPEQGYRACLGIMRLGKKVGTDRLEAACRRALAIGGHSYACVRNILVNGLDRQPLPDENEQAAAIAEIRHDNVRGSSYYSASISSSVIAEGSHAVASND